MTDASLASALDSDLLNEGLAAAWVTHGLGAEARARLATLGHLERVPLNRTLFREGEHTTHVGVVLQGRVALRLRVPERGQVTILTVEPGDVVGWSAVVAPYRATSTAVALSDCVLVQLDGVALRAALKSDQALAAEFYPLLLSAVARRLEGSRLQLLDLFSQRWVEPW